jgi:hypothetical protein
MKNSTVINFTLSLMSFLKIYYFDIYSDTHTHAHTRFFTKTQTYFALVKLTMQKRFITLGNYKIVPLTADSNGSLSTDDLLFKLACLAFY